MEQRQREMVNNSRLRDNASKLVFGDPIMCAQFLRGYSNLDILKNVQPEDIEDVSERFLPLFQESRESDTVKKIHLKGYEYALYLIVVVEHQSEVDYDMSFRMLRYIVMILTDYEQEQEKQTPGISKTKDFKYPPVLPIIYYEGTSEWNAIRNFADRVYLSNVLKEYIPNFEYLLVPLRKYSDEEILAKKDELSLVMLVNKLRNTAEFKKLIDLPKEYFEHLEYQTPEYLLTLIGRIIAALLYRMNVPKEDVDTFVDHITRREFDMMFDSFEAYDVQAMQRKLRKEIREELLEEIQKETIEKVRCKVEEEVRQEVTEEIRREAVKEVRQEVTEEIRREAVKEVRQEVMETQVRSLLRHGVSLELIKESMPEFSREELKKIYEEIQKEEEMKR